MDYKLAETFIELSEAYKIIESLGSTYPDFYHWYWNKVAPGVILGSDKVILAFNKEDLVGVSIIKVGIENKLRCLRIEPKYQSRGYGLYLIDKSLELLNDDKPLVSVNQNLINDYSRIFINRYNFNMIYVHKNLYKENELEYQFNGKRNSLIRTSLPF